MNICDLISLSFFLPVGMFDCLASETAQQWIVGLVLVGVFICFIKECIPVEVTALGATGILMLTGVLSSKEVLISFANSGPLTVVCMFILSAALEKTGAIVGLSRLFNRYAKGSQWRALILITLGAVCISAFVNNTPIVVIFMPVVLAFCRENSFSPSKLLIPLSYSTILGGTCSLVGTSTNVVVMGFCQQKGFEDLRMFTVTPLGIVYCAVGLLYMWFIGRRLLPNRDTLSVLLPATKSRDFMVQLSVREGSKWIDQKASELLKQDLAGLRIIEVRRRGTSLPEELPEIILQQGDRILVLTSAKKIAQIRESSGLNLGNEEGGAALDELEEREVYVAEGMIGLGSAFEGKTLAEIRFRQRYNLLVLAIHRKGTNITDKIAKTRLQFGDTLLFEGSQNGLNRVQENKQIIMLSQMAQDLHLTHKMKWAILAMVLFVLVGLLGSFPGNPVTDFCAQFNPFVLAYVGALFVMLTGCIRPKEAYQSVDWSIILLILGMLAVGKAMDSTGLAREIATYVVDVSQSLGPMGVVCAIYLLASVLTEMISNNAVAIVMAPLAFEIAQKFGANPLPFILAIMFGASASFATPIGYQTNTYVYNAGGYKFSDFIKIGLPLNILLWIVFTLLAPLFFPLFS